MNIKPLPVPFMMVRGAITGALIAMFMGAAVFVPYSVIVLPITAILGSAVGLFIGVMNGIALSGIVDYHKPFTAQMMRRKRWWVYSALLVLTSVLVVPFLAVVFPSLFVLASVGDIVAYAFLAAFFLIGNSAMIYHAHIYMLRLKNWYAYEGYGKQAKQKRKNEDLLAHQSVDTEQLFDHLAQESYEQQHKP